MKKTIAYKYENEVSFRNDLSSLDNIIACHFHYEYNSGYIVVEEKGEEDSE